MSEVSGNRVPDGAAGPQESVPAAVTIKEETSLIEAFENTLEVSQVGALTEASEETGGEKVEQAGQIDGQTASPPAAESSSVKSKWVVGAQCLAVWSEDGRVYPAKVVSVDGERCRVRFHGYSNEEEVEVSALRSPDAALQTQRQNSQDWKAGSRCRAVYSEDGLVYPAVVLWVKGQRCRIRFDKYNNEEEQDVSGLLSNDELHGPSRAAAKGSSWKWSERRENHGDRGAERRSGWRNEQQSEVKERASYQSHVEKEAEEKKRGAEKPTNHSFSFFPPVPPPPPPPPSQSGSADPVPFILLPPPPPPLWMLGGSSADTSSSMLMLWYTCGFYTGSYLAQQEFKSSSKH